MWIVYAMPGRHYCESHSWWNPANTAQMPVRIVSSGNEHWCGFAVSMHDTALFKVWWSNWLISTESGTHGWLRDTWQSGVSFCTKGSLVDTFKTPCGLAVTVQSAGCSHTSKHIAAEGDWSSLAAACWANWRSRTFDSTSLPTRFWIKYDSMDNQMDNFFFLIRVGMLLWAW